MARLNPSPFGDGCVVRPGMEIPPRRDDIHPRSLPEDRSEGCLGPDPILEYGIGHAPSGEPADDDGAGNPSPRVPVDRYGLEDEEEEEMSRG